jgi:hypothetical protein
MNAEQQDAKDFETSPGPDIREHKIWVWYSDGQIPCWRPATLGQLTDQFRDSPDWVEGQYMIRLDEPKDVWQSPYPQTGLSSPVKSRSSKIGYMCAVDFTYHLEQDVKPLTVYRTEQDLKDKRACVEECGAVEVEISVKKVLIEGHGT